MQVNLTPRQKSFLDKEAAQNTNVAAVYPQLIAAYSILAETFAAGGKLLICGNGGSAADADHIVGELMKGFAHKRPLSSTWNKRLENYPEGQVLLEKLQAPLPAISLSAHGSLFTAFGNDVDFHLVYAQQVLGYGAEGDVLMAISTSGNSANVLYAAVAARACGMRTITLTGPVGGRLAELSDVTLRVDAESTWKVQDVHGTYYHILCLLVEMYFWPE